MNNFNIRTKLYAISGIIFVAVVSLAFMIYSAMIKTQELDLSLTLIEAARSGMLSLRRDEKDFLARNNIKYVEKFHRNEEKLFEQLTRLEQLVSVYFPEQEKKLEQLSEHLTLYSNHFDQLAVIQQDIGLDQETGLRGQLRAAVHKAEEQLKGLGLIQLTADMLMLRRNEKDFIIRQQMTYLDKYNKNFDLLLTNLDRSGVDSAAQELIHKNMQDYRNGFQALVTSAQQKGLDHNSGLLGEMRAVVHQTETIFDQLATELDLLIAQQQRATLYKMVILLGLFMLIIVGALLLQARNISKRLATFDKLDHIITDDKIDLTVKLEESGNDEITNICRKFNYFINDLKSLIGNLPEISQKLNHSAESNITIANETTRLALEQKSQTDQIAVAIGQMIETIGDINSNIHDAASSAEKAKNDAFTGKDKITKATTSMNKLSTNMQQSTGITTELEVNSSDISQVLDVIRSIAEQTNLLALNAAIEAARAGENGRGFAVVADEVRTLAQRTQDSTEEIRSLIEKLHNGVQNTVRITQDSNENAATGVSAMEEAIASFEQISQTVNQMYQLNTAIATASEQQTATSENILANIAQISSATDQTSKHADMVMQSGDQFVNISSELGLLVSHYRF